MLDKCFLIKHITSVVESAKFEYRYFSVAPIRCNISISNAIAYVKLDYLLILLFVKKTIREFVNDKSIIEYSSFDYSFDRTSHAKS